MVSRWQSSWNWLKVNCEPLSDTITPDNPFRKITVKSCSVLIVVSDTMGRISGYFGKASTTNI